MDIHDNTIHFNSDPEMFEKEFTGVKRNTVRVIPNNEIKVNLEHFGRIEITNTETHMKFSRILSDVSKIDIHGTKVFIFSWDGEYHGSR